MKTILDEGQTWFLESLVYKDRLTIGLVEGIKVTSPGELKVGDAVIENLFPIEVTDSSRRTTITFENPVAWQVVDESYTTWDETEVRDTEGYLQVLSKSQYLDYVNENHGWYKDVAGDAAHFRVWTENEIIDVVANNRPEVVQN